MITTRDLNLREKEVKKNLYEMSSTLKAQPVGGTGALIQKPAQNTPQQKRTPVLFTPSPMVSSLPYLSDAVKYRSNEVSIMTNAMVLEQRKAKIIYDDIKQQELTARTDRVLDTLAKNISPSTSELLRNYLSNEISKTRQAERKVQLERMQRLDADLNTQTANITDTAALERIAIADARDQAAQKKFSNLAEARNAQLNMDILRDLRRLRENKLTGQLGETNAENLKDVALSMMGSAEDRPPIKVVNKKTGIEELRPASGSEMEQKKYSVPTILKGRATGQIPRIPFGIPLLGAGPKIRGLKSPTGDYPYPPPPERGGGGGGGGGGVDLAAALRGLQKGI